MNLRAHFLFSLFQVQLYMEIIGIYSLDIISGKLLAPGYLIAYWTDEQLVWNTSDFNDIEHFSGLADTIWVPSLIQFGAQDAKFDVAPVRVYSNGTVCWLMGGLFEAICKLDVLHYPFDEHVCTFGILPSATDSSEIKLTVLPINSTPETLIGHGEWEVTSAQSSINKFTEPIAGTSFHTFEKTLTLSRRYMFVYLHTCVPLILLTTLNMVVFLVPIRSGEKISFATAILLNFIIFTTSMRDTLPHNSLRLPYLSIFMAINNIITTGGVIVSVILCRMDDENVAPVPHKFKQIASKIIKKKLRRKSDIMAIQPTPDIDETETDTLSNADSGLPEKQDRAIGVKIEITWSTIAEIIDKIMFFLNLFDTMIIITVFSILIVIT